MRISIWFSQSNVARMVVMLLVGAMMLFGMGKITHAQLDLSAFEQAINNKNWPANQKNQFRTSTNELFDILSTFYEGDDLPVNLMAHMVRTGDENMQGLLEQLAMVSILYKEGASETDLFYEWNANRGFDSPDVAFSQQRATIQQQAAMFNNTQALFPTNNPMNDPNWFDRQLAENQLWAEQKRMQQKQAFETQANVYRMSFERWDPTQTDAYRYHQVYTQELERRKVEFRNRLNEWERKWNMLENAIFLRSGIKF